MQATEPDGHSVPDGWAAVRVDYEAGILTLNAVARRHTISRAAIELRATACKWQRPDSDGIDRRILINKLLGLLEQQIDVLEITMDAGNKLEAAVLGNLARDVDKLIGMQKAEAGAASTGAETAEMRDIQAKLAKRINAITKGKA